MLFAAQANPLIVIGMLAFSALMFGVWWWLSNNAFGAGRVRERGVVVRGWWVQANMNLFENGIFNWPAVIVFSFDEQEREDILRGVVEYLGYLKSAPPRSPLEAQMAQHVTNEAFIEGYRELLPLEFTAGLPVYIAHVKVKRSLLRRGKITEPFARFKALPDGDSTTVVMIQSE